MRKDLTETEIVKRDLLKMPSLPASDFLLHIAKNLEAAVKFERFRFNRLGYAWVGTDLEKEFEAVANLRKIASSLKNDLIEDCCLPENPYINPWVSDAMEQAGIDAEKASFEFHLEHGWIVSREDADKLNGLFYSVTDFHNGFGHLMSQFLGTGSLQILKELAENFSPYSA